MRSTTNSNLSKILSKFLYLIFEFLNLHVYINLKIQYIRIIHIHINIHINRALCIYIDLYFIYYFILFYIY